MAKKKDSDDLDKFEIYDRICKKMEQRKGVVRTESCSLTIIAQTYETRFDWEVKKEIWYISGSAVKRFLDDFFPGLDLQFISNLSILEMFLMHMAGNKERTISEDKALDSQITLLDTLQYEDFNQLDVSVYIHGLDFEKHLENIGAEMSKLRLRHDVVLYYTGNKPRGIILDSSGDMAIYKGIPLLNDPEEALTFSREMVALSRIWKSWEDR